MNDINLVLGGLISLVSAFSGGLFQAVLYHRFKMKERHEDFIRGSLTRGVHDIANPANFNIQQLLDEAEKREKKF